MTSACSRTDVATTAGDTNRLYMTNNYSIISKYSAIKLGYFKDEPLTRFIEDFLQVNSWRRTPVVNRGYSARLLALDWIVERSIKHEKIDCAIILGAGFDMTPIRRMGECIWIEIDLPQVIHVKCQYFEQKLPNPSDIVRQADNTVISFPSLGLHLISCDLMDTNQLATKLRLLLATIGQRSHVALINEVCLCYIEENHVASILKTVIDSVQAMKINYIGYEQVRPSDGQQQMARFMSEHFQSLGHHLRYFPTEDQIKKLLVNQLGFDHVTIASMYQLFHTALLERRQHNNEPQLEPFDEFEEMDLYLSHYALIMGSLTSDRMGPLKPPKSSDDYDQLMDKVGSIVIGESSDTSPTTQSNPISFLASPQIARYGHSTCILTDTEYKQEVLMNGGFGLALSNDGKPSGQHRRLSSCCVLSRDLATGSCALHELNCDNLTRANICLDRMHGQVCHLGGGVLFFSGGRHSPGSLEAWCSTPFVAKLCQLDGPRLQVSGSFRNCRLLRWRHRVVPLMGGKAAQVGGLSGWAQGTGQPRILWDVSRLDRNPIYDSDESSYFSFNRHSFAMARFPDSDTIVIFGGLAAHQPFKDTPIRSDLHTVIWDTRQMDSFALDEIPASSCCYGGDIHFVSSCQFVRIGGISTATGLNNQTVELFDLRSSSQPIPLATLPSEGHLGDAMILTNGTSENFLRTREIFTYGGGGNYFTFGTHFNKSHLIYKYE